ncbi:hypothetical protein ACMFMG_010204 [Clarireedia jacksonii]
MGDMATFENLIPDVKYMILKNASTTEFLWSLIRASPAFYNIFLARRADILSTLIARIIGPEVWDDALAALDTEDLDFTAMTIRNEIETVVEKYEGFHNHLVDRSTQRRILPLDDVLKLYKIHHDVVFLTDKLAADLLGRFDAVAQELNNYKEPELGSSPISRIERGRLYRAWYRYLFIRNALRDNSFESLNGLRVRVLRCYSECQVEELHCVASFVEQIIEEKWRRVGDEYLSSIIQTDPGQWDVSPPSNANSRWDGDDCYFSQRFTEEILEAFFGGLTNVKFPVLRTLLASEGEDLRQTIMIPMDDFADTTLAHSMTCGVPLLNDYDMEMPRGEHALDQSEGEGWLWAYGRKGNKKYRCPSSWLSGGSQLRYVGYIFWDSTRFQASKIMEHSLDDVKTVIRRNQGPRARNPLSVERRLQMFYKLQM